MNPSLVAWSAVVICMLLSTLLLLKKYRLPNQEALPEHERTRQFLFVFIIAWTPLLVYYGPPSPQPPSEIMPSLNKLLLIFAGMQLGGRNGPRLAYYFGVALLIIQSVSGFGVDLDRWGIGDQVRISVEYIVPTLLSLMAFGSLGTGIAGLYDDNVKRQRAACQITASFLLAYACAELAFAVWYCVQILNIGTVPRMDTSFLFAFAGLKIMLTLVILAIISAKPTDDPAGLKVWAVIDWTANFTTSIWGKLFGSPSFTETSLDACPLPQSDRLKAQHHPSENTVTGNHDAKVYSLNGTPSASQHTASGPRVRHASP